MKSRINNDGLIYVTVGDKPGTKRGVSPKFLSIGKWSAPKLCRATASAEKLDWMLNCKVKINELSY